MIRRAPGRALSFLAVLAWLGVGGCAADWPAPPAGDEDRAQRMIESGNDAYRDGDYETAARRYAAAAVIRKEDAAAYYGLGMALSKLGRDEDARVAYARARELAGR